MGYHLKNKMKYLMKRLNKRVCDFENLKDKINPNKLIYNNKTEGNSLKDFRDYWELLELFENVRNDDVNPREVLKNQIN